MSVVAFDTLIYANKLKEAGMEAHLADVQSQETAKILSDLTIKQLATKQDLEILKQDLKDSELKIIKWMIGLLFSQTAFLLSVIHFIK